MLKPMGKKTGLTLPAPPEWPAATAAAAPSANAAALRIQLRYLQYRAKVRALLRKAERLADAQDDGGSAAASKAVTGSSLALAAAFQAKAAPRDPRDATAKAPPVAAGPGTFCPPDAREAPRADAVSAAAWGRAPRAWPSAAAGASERDEPEGETRCSDEPLADSADCSAAQWGCGAAGEARGIEDDGAVQRQPSGFVNVMETSWLLSSIEQRCRQQGGGSPSGSKAGSIADLSHLMLDMLFIFRSGVDVNLHGRPPSSVSVHHQNLLARVSERVLERDGRELTPDDERRVSRIFRGLQSDMIMPAVRCLGWILTKTWRMLFHGLHVDIDSLHRVREILEAAEGDVSVVFTPTHKTHLDYLIISYLCFAYGIPLPRIAAGNNLDLPVIGSFLRANGSFFIRRSFRDDLLYKQVLEHYVHELLSDGNPVEVFIEGGRSRHGRVCKPRLGFLSMFLDYVRQTRPEEDSSTDNVATSNKTVLLVPISLDYDKVYEVEEYANQLLGKPKEKESLKMFFKSVWDIVFLRCGHTYVRFGEPVAVTAESSLNDVASTIATRMQTAGTVTATAIVSSLLMWKRKYITRDMLDTRSMWLVHELEARGATVAHDDDNDLVDHALSILNVKVASNGVVTPHAEYPVRALELGFYRNHLLHVFLPEMAVVGAVDSLLWSNAESEVVSLSMPQIVDKTRIMWAYLRHICRHEDVDIEKQVKSVLASFSAHLNGATGPIEVNLQQWRSNKMLGFMLSLQWSFADSLWIATLGLHSLDSSEKPPTDRDFVRRVQTLAKELFVRKQLEHAEALCGESIKQALDFLIERSLVRRECTDNGSVLFIVGGDAASKTELWSQEVNSWRQPRSFLWKRDTPATNVTREEARALMACAGANIYARWMAPPM